MIGICGLGIVGRAVQHIGSIHNLPVRCYDKYKEGFTDFSIILETDMVFLTLPTPFSEEKKGYNLEALYDVLTQLYVANYQGLVIIKSTILPGTIRKFHETFPSLRLIHNPEFLSAKTALHDIEHQSHIVIGTQYENNEEAQALHTFYKRYYPEAQYSLCKWEESETMKIACNTFYAVKIQFFNELYQLVRSLGSTCSYESVVLMMVRNGWITPQHTQVPGHDGKLSYGGMCFPKDTQALLQCMIQHNVPHQVLQATIEERNIMRNEKSS